MIPANAKQQYRKPTPAWIGRIAIATALSLTVFLSSCGDVGGPAFDEPKITPQSLVAQRQVLSGTSQDFNGGGKSDILWRNSNGQVAIWLMNGMAQTSSAVIATVSTDWTIVGPGDFDGDGKSDILWRNSNGQVAIWLMDGMAQKSGAVIAAVGNDWTIAGSGDFNGDGKRDILWRNSNGQVAIWLMNGMAQTSSAVIATVGTDWTIVGSGDFDGDAKSDIVWRNSNGQVAIWLMNGLAQKSGAVIAAVGTDWTIAGSGDFDGDGKSDILWRNSNGQVAIWLMNGMAQSSSAVIATVSTAWTIVCSGDFDGDGKSDILWRNSNGQVAIWLMNGLAQKSGAVIAAVGTDWTIAGVGDLNGGDLGSSPRSATNSTQPIGAGSSGRAGSSADSATNFTAAAIAGELLTYTLNTTALTYSYRITESQYGLAGVSRSGTLINNGDGTYTPSGVNNGTVAMLPNGLLLSSIYESVRGIPRTIPVMGISNPVTTLSNTTFNYIQRVCWGTYCEAGYGTFRLTTAETWSSCPSVNLTTGCSQGYSGTVRSQGGGTWQVFDALGVNVGTAVVLLSPNGQQVVFLDMKDSRSDGFGIGLLVGSTQQTGTTTQSDGTWVAASTSGDSGQFLVSGNRSTCLIENGVLCNYTSTLTLNYPWTGYATLSSGGYVTGYALLAGTGMYALYGGGDYVEIGVKIR